MLLFISFYFFRAKERMLVQKTCCSRSFLLSLLFFFFFFFFLTPEKVEGQQILLADYAFENTFIPWSAVCPTPAYLESPSPQGNPTYGTSMSGYGNALSISTSDSVCMFISLLFIYLLRLLLSFISYNL